MDIRKMNLEEVKVAYEANLMVDFPKEEIKPLDKIEKLMKKGVYETWGFYEEDRLQAYAWVCKPKDSSLVLLDYFAVCEGRRGRGIGSKFLRLLKEKYKECQGILLEAEDVLTSNKEQEELRISRIHFYEKNGVRLTNLHIQVFKVNYVILVYDCQANPTNEEAKIGLANIYHTFLSDSSFDKNVCLN